MCQPAASLGFCCSFAARFSTIASICSRVSAWRCSPAAACCASPPRSTDGVPSTP